MFQMEDGRCPGGWVPRPRDGKGGACDLLIGGILDHLGETSEITGKTPKGASLCGEEITKLTTV